VLSTAAGSVCVLIHYDLRSIASGVDDGIVIRMQPMREEALLEVEPHALDRVELGIIGWQRHWGHGFRHAQIACAVPTGLIENSPYRSCTRSSWIEVKARERKAANQYRAMLFEKPLPVDD
jgi:hypothetical protein